RNAKKLNERSRALSAVPLCNICSYRGCRTTYLRRQAEHFLPWKLFGQPVANLGERHRILPDAKIAVGIDRLAQPIPPFAIRYSPFAYLRPEIFFFSATSFSSSAEGLTTSPSLPCHSFIFASTRSRPIRSP